MYVCVFGRAKVASEKQRLDPFQERRIGCHHVFKEPMLRASLAHYDATVVFNNLRLDLARMGVHQSLDRRRAVDHRGTYFLDAARAERIGRASCRERVWSWVGAVAV